MQNKIETKEAKSTDDFSAAKALILEYVAWLGEAGGPEVKAVLASQNFDKEMETLPITYGYPDGALFLVMVNDDVVGVAGIKRFNASECEVKRMFVREQARGMGIGKLLITACIETAKKLKYEMIKLDSADFMLSAIKLYTDHGFVEIEAYRENTHKGAKYFELDLKKKMNK